MGNLGALNGGWLGVFEEGFKGLAYVSVGGFKTVALNGDVLGRCFQASSLEWAVFGCLVSRL